MRGIVMAPAMWRGIVMALAMRRGIILAMWRGARDKSVVGIGLGGAKVKLSALLMALVNRKE